MKYIFVLIFTFFFAINSIHCQVENVHRKTEVQLINNDSLCYFNGSLYTGRVVDFFGQKFDKTKMLFDGYFKDGQRNGVIKKWYTNFKIESIENYKLGFKDGVQAFFFNNGNKKAEYKYVNGSFDGVWTEWYDNKQLKVSYNYSQGKIVDGTYPCFSPTGEKESEAIYKNGSIVSLSRNENGKFVIIQELVTETYQTGQKMAEGLIVSGLKEGSWLTWYEDGAKKSEKTYLSGKLSGHFIMYYNNGIKQCDGFYKIDCKDGTWTSWHENGQLKAEEKYIEGKKEGIWTTYYDNGQINSIGNYSNNFPDGKWKSYYVNGKIQDEGLYKSGIKEGQWISWYDNGQKRFDGSFSNDLENGYGIKYYSSDGNSYYKGQWKSGVRWGNGEYFQQNDLYVTYVGEFENDKYNGKGTMKIFGSNNSILSEFTGEWKDGQRYNGKEVRYYHYTNGTTQTETKNYVNGKESFWNNVMDRLQNQPQKRY